MPKLYIHIAIISLVLTACGVRVNGTSEVKEIRSIPEIAATDGIAAWNSDVLKHSDNKEFYTECAETKEIAHAYLCASNTLKAMNRALVRATLFVEGTAGAPRGIVVSQDHMSVFRSMRSIMGHDLRSQDLLNFWAAATKLCSDHQDEANFCPNAQEQDFFANFVLPLSTKSKEFVVITYALAGEATYQEVVSHEIMHAQYFLQSDFMKIVDEFWEKDVTASDKEITQSLLAPYYDTKDSLLVRNEFQAYILMVGARQNILSDLVGVYRNSLVEKLKAVGIEPVQVQ